MILAFDTYYFEDSAKTIGLQFENWSDSSYSKIFEESLSNIDKYVSGEFFKRELPCILSLIRQIDLSKCKAIIIDGYVYLDDENHYGLGAHLFEKLENKIPIIGVAKNNFKNIVNLKIEIFRGASLKPLFITSAGMDVREASELIKNMYGKYRIPELLKKVDSLGRM